MAVLASLDECKGNNEALIATLSTLLEPSSILTRAAQRLGDNPDSLNQCHTYTELIELVFDEIGNMDSDSKAKFIAGHPRIGETRNLSTLSTKEQASTATPPEVLERLAVLNGLYEQRYPGLRYITFVNGRTRLQIADELQSKLDASSSLPVEVGGDAWRAELARALRDVQLIAESRLKVLKME